jgi:NAD(P)H-flavin reductase
MTFFNTTDESWQTSRIITYGWLALVFALPLVVFSLPWFRRNKFEWFYYSHFLFIPFMILLHLHYPYMIYYAAAGLAGYIQDKLLWFLSSRRPIRILSLTTPVRGYVCLEVAVDPSYSFEPGQWVQINIPAISLLQWHPMSVTSVPGHSSISMDIKVLGDWTRRLEELALQFDASNYSHTTVFMDFFHGSSHLKDWGYLTHPAVIMVAGGIGITPMISAMRTIVSNGIPGIQRVYLVWVVKNESVVDLYREELAHYQAMGNTKFGCKIEVTVHVTLSESESMEASVENKSVKISSGFNPEHLVFFPFRSRNQYWFRQHVYGYGHLLLLVIGSGGGYLVGIFLANFASLNKDLSRESVALLQLSLGSLFAALLVFIGMSGSFSKSTVWTPQKRKCCESTTTIETGLKSKAFLFNNEEAKYELRCVIGCRPDLSAIATDVKSWCRGNGASSIGVSVCGPDSLVDSVAKLCRNNSSCGTPYFLDMETFEW